MSWNSFPLHTRNCTIKWLRNNAKTRTNDDKNDKKKIIWDTLPYLGHVGDKMKKRCFKKVKKCLTEIFWFFRMLWITKACYVFLHQRHYSQTPKSNIIYCITFFWKNWSKSCHAITWAWPTWRSIHASASFKMWTFYGHCEFNEITGYWFHSYFLVKNQYLLSKVLISDICSNWSQLFFLERFYITTLAPKINDWLKASWKLVLCKTFHSALIDSILSISTFQLLSFSEIFYMWIAAMFLLYWLKMKKRIYQKFPKKFSLAIVKL